MLMNVVVLRGVKEGGSNDAAAMLDAAAANNISTDCPA